MRIPILCYHSQIVSGNDYRRNGHLALAQDLHTITRLGVRIVSLTQVMDWHQGHDALSNHKVVAITFDDGMCTDFAPVQHPQYGELPGFLPILQAFRASPSGPQQPDLHASAFVIASDRARREIDAQCHDNRGWDRADWWPEAARSPLLTLENHSWDHNHEVCSEAPGQPSGTFQSITSHALCDHEIRRASEWIAQRCAYRPRFFAYPYGEYNAYLSENYLPRVGPQLGLRAAFTTAGRHLTRDHSPWLVPRFVHGFHWRSTADLEALLSTS